MNLKIRQYNPKDAQEIDRIYNRCHSGTFNLPQFNHLLSAAIVEEDSRMVAFGGLEVLLEGMMVLDADLPLRTKIKALEMLVQNAEFASKINGFKEFYSFPSISTFSELLQKKFNFEPCSPLLIKRCKNGQ